MQAIPEVVATWEIDPALPSGLFMSGGVISGTPSVNQTTPVTYTLYANNSGGSDSETFTITINEPVANLGAIADQTFTRDSAITNIVASNTGGAVATWAIYPTLPAGLSMTGGVISGTPTVNQTTAVTYTLYANNSGGSDSETFSITINEPVAILTSIAHQTFTRGVTISDIVIVNSGGAVAVWEIDPALPAGLSMVNGVISGTPTVNQTTGVIYNLYANNSGGSTSIYFEIVINEPPAILASIADQTYTRGVAITNLVASNTGGNVVSWEIEPALPTGLTMTNGVISGTPSVNMSTTEYTLHANNSGGNVNVSFDITVNEPLAILGSVSNQVFTRSVIISPVTISNTGGAIATWEIHPALPNNLQFANGVLSGRSNSNMTETTYTVYANNSGGSVNTSFTITVNEIIPSISTISNQVYTRGVTISTITVSNSGGPAASWEIEPALPSGLSMANGVISGTPTVNQTTAVTYTLYANNTGGSDSETFTITINEPIPNLASISDQTFTRGTAITNVVASNSGGAVATWEIDPALPAGLNLVNGVISGTPTVNQTTAVTYTLYANNSGGSDSETFTITINEPVANLGAIADQTFTRDSAITNVVASNSGGAVASWAIHPTLPAGLSMTNGVISGTPTVNQTTAVTYTLYANNSGGSDSETFTITINEPVANLGPIADQTFTRDSAITNVVASNTGGAIATWEIDPALPAGLSMTNGVISGTPTVNQTTAVTYTLYANNSGGSDSETFTITINEPVANLGPITDQTFTRAATITNVVASNTGGAVATWAIHPTLPAGLSMTNGVISGTPTVNQTTAVTYTLYANNSGGSDSETFTITINEPVANLGAITDQTFTRGVTITDVVASNTGGAVATWEIDPTLPSGLTFSNGVISGTPSVNSTQVTYTIYANNSGGSSSTTVSITINEPAASLTPSRSSATLTRGVAMTAITIYATNGNVQTWAVHPTLPAGLSLSSGGVITGTPTVNSSAIVYTIFGNNTGGSQTRQLR